METKTRIPSTGLGGAGIGLTLLGGVGVVIGSFGTWVTSDFADASASGLDKDGPFLIVLTFIATGIVLFASQSGLKRAGWLIAAVLAAALCVLIGFLDLGDVDSNGIGGLVEAGWGLKLAAYVSIVMLAGTVCATIATFRERGNAPPAPPAETPTPPPPPTS
jgi:hypothetical protein